MWPQFQQSEPKPRQFLDCELRRSLLARSHLLVAEHPLLERRCFVHRSIFGQYCLQRIFPFQHLLLWMCKRHRIGIPPKPCHPPSSLHLGIWKHLRCNWLLEKNEAIQWKMIELVGEWRQQWIILNGENYREGHCRRHTWPCECNSVPNRSVLVRVILRVRSWRSKPLRNGQLCGRSRNGKKSYCEQGSHGDHNSIEYSEGLVLIRQRVRTEQKSEKGRKNTETISGLR